MNEDISNITLSNDECSSISNSSSHCIQKELSSIEETKLHVECSEKFEEKTLPLKCTENSFISQDNSYIPEIKSESIKEISLKAHADTFNKTKNNELNSSSVNTFEDNSGSQTSSSEKNYCNAPNLNNNQICNQEGCFHVKQELRKAVEVYKTHNEALEKEISDLKISFTNQEVAFRKTESRIRAEFFSNIEKLSKECNVLRKEKEDMVIRYANSEKEVIIEKKVQQELEKKLKELYKEIEILQTKVKTLNSDNTRLSTNNDNKMVENAKIQKEFEKLNADYHAKEIKIKWLRNKFQTEATAHQETQAKLENTIHRLNEMKEEAEQVRKDCQDMVKCYQEAEEIKSVKLDSQLKQKVSELEVHKQEKDDQQQVYHLLRLELEALKNNQRMSLEENNSLTLKINSLERERFEYGQNVCMLKENQNMLNEQVADLTARLNEMCTLQIQLEREKEKSAACLREIERLRLTNAELQSDMNACHFREGDLLQFTEGVTDRNVQLQSSVSNLESSVETLNKKLDETTKQYLDSRLKSQQLESELSKALMKHDDEVQLLARKLAEKTKNVENLNVKLDEAENENRVLKRRHIASIKELSRELFECKKRLDNYESTNVYRAESLSLGSRCSSFVSLDITSDENRHNASSPVTSTHISQIRKESPDSSSANLPEFPEIDKEMLIERIIKLQKILARKNDKIDLLEDHVVELVREMRKKCKSVNFKPV